MQTRGQFAGDTGSCEVQVAVFSVRIKQLAEHMKAHHKDYSTKRRLQMLVYKRNRLLNPREREVVAHHEMGHALVALSLPGTDIVHKVSIIPRGVGALALQHTQARLHHQAQAKRRDER